MKSRLSPWRWAVLAAIMGINLSIQTLWISFAPIAGPAADWFKVGDMEIGLLAMVFMIVFVPLSIPASWVLDRFGFRVPLAVASLATAAFGILRGIVGADYNLALLWSIGIAVTQPFLLNAWTKVPAQWFPRTERALAVGLTTLSNLLGTALGMVLPPLLLDAGIGIGPMQTLFGGLSLVTAAVFIILARESPPQPPEPKEDRPRVLMFKGLGHALTVKAFWATLVIAFIGLGLFNGITTWVEAIIRPRGFSPEAAGLMGVLVLLGGLLGSVILPALSDREAKRPKYLFIALAGSLPGLLGITIATDPVLLHVSAFLFGFFLVSALPIAMQYTAEITRPTPEASSNGLIQLCGQASVVFVWLMASLRSPDGAFTPGLLAAAGLVLAAAVLSLFLKDQPLGAAKGPKAR